MKIVRIVENYVREIIPDDAKPIENWYPDWFCNQCVEADDEVQQNWYYNGENFYEKAPIVESDMVLHASDLANAIRSGVKDTL